MSTFVVRFVGTAPEAFSGKVRHVRSGEEGIFSSSSDLLRFFERMNASCHDDSEADLVGEPLPDPREAGTAGPPTVVDPRQKPHGGPPTRGRKPPARTQNSRSTQPSS